MSDFDQEKFNKFIISNSIVGFFNEPVKLKSGKMSNWYINWRTIAEDAFLMDRLSNFVIQFTRHLNLNPHSFYGVPEGATKIAIITQYKWAQQSLDYGPGSHTLPMGRGKPKEHGNAKDRNFLCLPKGETVVIEDVTTTGNSLINTIKSLLEEGVDIAAVISLTNRMELRDDGRTVKQAIEDMGIHFHSMSNALDLLPEAYETVMPSDDVAKAIEKEFADAGIAELSLTGEEKPKQEDAKEQPKRSIIPSCDVTMEEYEKIVRETADIEKVGGYKVGFYLMLTEGLPEIVLEKDTLYNHRAASTDIPETGESMMEALQPYDKIKGVILTPLSGPETQRAWIRAAIRNGKEAYIEPILDTDTFLKSKGGYIEDKAVVEMINLGLSAGATGFILPDNEIGKLLEQKLESKTKVIIRRQGLLDSDFDELTAYDVMPYGLKKVVEAARKHTDKPIIYDHQKAATDLPAKAKEFSKAAKEAGIDAVILFPQAGSDAEKEWIASAQAEGLKVIVGGLMTHPKYVRSEGGYISDEAIMEIYLTAASLGVTDFVVPGNKPEAVQGIRARLQATGIKPTFYAPGFVAQGGEISETAKAAGERWHAIVGRGIYKTDDIRKAALELTSKI